MQQQQQQQQHEQQHHKMGVRSASGLEELIMGCTSTNSNKEVSVNFFDSEFHAILLCCNYYPN